MNLIQRAKLIINNNYFEEYVRRFQAGEDMPGESGYSSINAQTAMKYSAVFACCRVLGETFASMPAMEYRKNANGDRETTRDTSAFDILHNAPNEEMAPFSFKEACMMNLNLGGNAVSEKLVNRFGDIVGLYPYKWQNVNIDRDRETKRLVYRVIDGASQKTLKREQVFHVPGISFDGIIGLSPIEYAASAIRLGMSYEQFGVNFYKNGANSSGAFSFPNELKEESFQRLKKDLKENYAGLKNTGTPMLLEAGGKFEQFAMKPADAQLIENKRFQTEDIARIYRMPLHLIQELSRCMPADAMVFTEHGPKRIVDVKKGERVWSVGKDGFILKPVVDCFNNGASDIIKLVTTNRTIRCNANHKILVRRNRLTPLKAGIKGGHNLNGRKYNVEWVNEYIPAGEIGIGDIIITLQKLPHEGVVVAPNGRKLTIGFMEFCGLMLGDGNVMANRGLQISRGESACYMDHYRSVMKNEFVRFGNRTKVVDRKTAKTYPVHLLEEERQTKFSSVLAAEEMTMLGFAGTCRTKKVPGWVFTVSEELKLAVLRGFLDSDGTVDRKGRLTYYSSNDVLLHSIRHLCMACGIPVTNVRYDDQETQPPEAKRPHTTRMFRFTCSDPMSNLLIGSHDERYIERLSTAQPFNIKNRHYPRQGGLDCGIMGAGMAKVVRIEKLPAGLVYDLCIQDTHSFIADGVVVHNSTNNNIEHQSLEFVMYTMLPWFKRWEENINMQLLTPAERRAGYYIEFKIDALLRGDAKSRAEAYAAGRQWGWLSVNDIRRLENMPAIANGDIYMMPMNFAEASKEVQAADKVKAMAEEIYKMIIERG